MLTLHSSLTSPPSMQFSNRSIVFCPPSTSPPKHFLEPALQLALLVLSFLDSFMSSCVGFSVPYILSLFFQFIPLLLEHICKSFQRSCDRARLASACLRRFHFVCVLDLIACLDQKRFHLMMLPHCLLASSASGKSDAILVPSLMIPL